MQNTIKTTVWRFFAASLALLVAATLTTSCGDNDDETLPIDPAQSDDVETVCTPSLHTLSIPATLDGDASLSKAVTISGTSAIGRFETTEKIYVYNVSKSAMLGGTLSPANFSNDGKSCTLTGELTGTIEANDQITLLYNLNGYYSDPANQSAFLYRGQTGAESSLIDGGIAENLTVKSTEGGTFTTNETAKFTLCQAIFRFKFADNESGNPIKVKTLKISSYGGISSHYMPLLSSYSPVANVTITPSAPTSDYIYVAVRIFDQYASGDVLTFSVTDADDYEYQGTKSAPDGGFKNGNFYYNTNPIPLENKGQLVKPTITWGEGTTSVEPDDNKRYNVFGPYNGGYQPSSLTLSGTSQGYYFYFNYGSSLKLDNFTATYKGSRTLLESSDDLNIEISGTNNITCGHYQAIAAGGTLKLSGKGTLVLTATNEERKGIYGNNYAHNGSNTIDPQVLAADGYTVTCSKTTVNGDGTYTWTYAVTPTD